MGNDPGGTKNNCLDCIFDFPGTAPLAEIVHIHVLRHKHKSFVAPICPTRAGSNPKNALFDRASIW